MKRTDIPGRLSSPGRLSTLTNDPVITVSNGQFVIVESSTTSTRFEIVITPDGEGDIKITLPVGSFESRVSGTTFKIKNEVEFTHTLRHVEPSDDIPGPPTAAAATMTTTALFVRGQDSFSVTIRFNESAMLTNDPAIEVSGGLFVIINSSTSLNYGSYYGVHFRHQLVDVSARNIFIQENFKVMLNVFKSAVFAFILVLTPLVIGASGASAQVITPNITVRLSEAPTTASQEFTIKVEFILSVVNDRTSVAGYDGVSDFVVTNGTAISSMEINPHPDGVRRNTYRVTFKPTGEGDIEIYMPAGKVRNPSGNANAESNRLTVTYVNLRPSVTLSGAPSSTVGLTPFEVTAMFSEPVQGLRLQPYGLIDDIAIIGVTVSNGTGRFISSSNGRRDFVLEITPDGAGDVRIFIPKNAAFDPQFQGNTLSNVLTVPNMPDPNRQDTTPPTMALNRSAISEGISQLNSTSERTFEVFALFTENIRGFTADDVVVSNGMAEFNGPLEISEHRIRQSMFITHDGSATEIMISVPAGTYADLAGNPNVRHAGGHDARTIIYDATAPTVVLSGKPDPLTVVSAAFELTATFSENVTGFTADDIQITNGAVTIAGAGMTYTLTITPASAPRFGEIVITILEHVTDNGNKASNTVSVTYNDNPSPPAVALTGPQDNTTRELTFEVMARFTHDTRGFTADDVVVSNGMAEFNGPPISEQLRQPLTITHDGSAAEIVISIPAGSFTDLEGTPNIRQGAGLDTITVTYIAPVTVMLTGFPEGTISGVFELTATFSESVTGFIADDIDISNAMVEIAGSGTTYTLTITPAGTGNFRIGIRIPEGVANNVNNDGNNEASNLVNVDHDPQPFVTLSGPSSATGLTPFEVTATFTEDVHRFDAAVGFTLLPIDITSIPVTVTNGMGRVKSHSGRTFVLEITPAGTGDSIDIFLPKNAVIDSSFLGNARSNELTVTYSALTVELSTTSEAVNDAAPFSVTIAFSEAVTGFVLDDIVFTNATASGVLQMNNASTYEVSVIADNPGDVEMFEIMITVPAGAAMAGERMNLASNTLELPYDYTPTVVLAADATSMSNPFTVTATFSEAVTGFAVDDITIDNGMVTTVTTVTTGGVMPDGAVYTLTIMPTAAGDVTLSIPAGGAHDLDGALIANTASNTLVVAYTVDIIRPTVTFPTPPVNHDGTNPFMVIVTLSETAEDFDLNDIEFFTNNATGTLSGNGTDYTLTVMPTDNELLTISVPADGFTDAEGNMNIASPLLSVLYTAVDAIRPTVKVTGPAAYKPDGETRFMVRLSFSEDVTGVATGSPPSTNNNLMAQFSILNGDTNGAIKISDSVYDVGIVPSPGTTDDIRLTFNAGVAMDTVGNTNTVSNTLVVPSDNTAPMVTLTAPDIVNRNAPFTVTAEFSEAVTGFDEVADITVDNGMATALTPEDNSKTRYTLTIMPADNGDVVIDILAGVAMDEVGNGNEASRATVTSDGIPPEVTFTTPPASHDGTSSFMVTVTLSETAVDFELSDIEFSANVSGMLSGSGTDYTLTVTPADTDTNPNPNPITISIPEDSFTDAVGNGNTAPEPLIVPYVDNTPPMVTLSGPTTVSTRASFEVTAMFTEAVAGFDAIDDINVTGGTAIAPVAVGNDNMTYTLTITPDDTNNAIEISIPMAAAMDLTNNPNIASAPLTVAYEAGDTIPPTVVFSNFPANHDGTSSFMVTVTLSESSTNFELGDISHNAASITLLGSGTGYTLTVMPNDLSSSITINIPADRFTDATGNQNTASLELVVIPQITQMLTGPDVVNSEFIVSVEFTEDVSGFDAADDITVTGGATTAVPMPVGSSKRDYTLTITPPSTGDGDIGITIKANVASNDAGNTNVQSAELMVRYDTIRPTVELRVGSATSLDQGADGVVRFSEEVTGLEAHEIEVTNGEVTLLQGSGTSYTLNIMPNGSGEDMVIVIPEGVAMDEAGNLNVASDPVTVSFLPPTVVLSGAPTSVSNTNTFAVTATFSKAVVFSDTAGITIANGSVTEVTGSGAVYTLTIEPDGMGDIKITIPANVAASGANSNLASEPLIIHYGAPLTVALSSATASARDLSSFTVTATFSESVTGLEAAEIEVANGEVTMLVGNGPMGGGDIYTLTIEPDGMGDIEITIPAGVAEGDAGRTNRASTNPVSVTYDATPPTVELTGAPATANGSTTTFEVTATFSEAVTGFDAIADITVTNGTATVPVAVGNSETDYTLTITPNGTDSEITISIAAGVAEDTVGNGNTASTNAVRVTYDATPPMLMSLTGPAAANTMSFQMTATFTEPVTDFALPDITVTNGMATAFQGSGATYTLTIMPDGNGPIGITIAADAVADNAGNLSVASTTVNENTVNVPYDVTAPTVELSGNPDAVNDLTSFAVTATFFEPVTGFDVMADITVTNGEAAAPTPMGSSDTVYTLTITPDGMGTIEITIPTNAATDTAGNGNTASSTVEVTYDATAPTVALRGAVSSNSLDIEVMVVFSEEVTGFTAEDVEVNTGTVSLAGSPSMTNGEIFQALLITHDGTVANIEISIPVGTFTDTLGNLNTAASGTFTVAYTDDTPPTVELTSATTTVAGPDDTFTVTATFTEDVTGFDSATDITVINGIAGNADQTPIAPVSVDGSGKIYTLTIAPNGNGNISISIPANAAMDGAGLGNSVSEALTVTYTETDTAPPRGVLTPSSGSSIGESSTGVYARNSNAMFEVTVTFDEPVTGFELMDLSVQGGTASNLLGMDEASVYTFDVTPSGTGTVQVSLLTGITDLIGNVSIDGGVGFQVTYDTTPPTVELSGYPATANGSTATFAVTATFSEPVPGFGVADITVDNGAVALSGSGTTYTLTITPDTDGEITIEIPADVVTDAAGNGNEASTNANGNMPTDPVRVTYDGTAPSVTLISATTTVNTRDPFAVTATFNEPVTGFDVIADITVTGGTVTAPVAMSNSERTYTLTGMLGDTDGEISISIAAGAATDTAGNGNKASTNTVRVTYDTTAPTVTLTSATTTASNRDPFTVTATFSEAVTGFDAIADITVTGGTAMVPVAVGNSGTDYTLTIMPGETDGEITIEIAAGAATDTAGNGNEASTSPVRVTYDTTVPTVMLSDYPTAVNTRDPFAVTATFSEAVTGFDVIADITVTGGTAIAPVAVDATTYMLTITPAAGTGDIEISIPEAAAVDAANNGNTATTRPVLVTYDATAPTVELTGAPATVNTREPFAVTATFSEAVTGFDVIADITVTNGAATALVAVDATTYTLTITPAGIAGVITISIAADVATDTAGNGNEASTNPVRVTYDAAALTVTLTSATTIVSNRSFTVTAIFSGPVTGFDAIADITVTGGTAMVPVAMGSSVTTYTLTIMPGETDGEITIEIPADAAMDVNGNGNEASTNPVRVTYDGTAPTVVLSDYPNKVSTSDSFEMTATFSEAVTGFDAIADITVTNGTAIAPVTVNATTYTLIIMPDGGGDNDPGPGGVGQTFISIPVDAATDTVGNGNTASSRVRVEYEDSTQPTVMLSDYPNVVNGSFTMTATFFERVKGFNAATDIMVTNGVAAAPTLMDNSDRAYTLTITPNGAGNITVTIPADAVADLRDNRNIASNPVTVTYDGTAPTVVLSDYPDAVNSLTEFTVTATFFEPVTGFDAMADITVTNGVAAVPTPMGSSDTVYTLTITPDGMGTIGITIPADAATDAVGNRNTASNEVSVTYDATAPTVMLTGAPTTVNSTATFDVTATFDEAVTGFNAVADITVTNGAATVPVAVSNSETTYTLNITPDGSNLDIEIFIPADAAMDDADNPNAASETLTVTYAAPADTTPPTVTLTGPDPATFSNTEAFVVTATFSKAVTGFDAEADITVTNGAATVPVAMGNSGTTYTLNITPAGTDDIEIFIPAAAAMDGADNPNTASETLTVTYTDTTRPTATLFSAAVFNNLGELALELTFSEVVTGTPSTTEIGTSTFIEVDNGTAQGITDFGVGFYELYIQPTSISADVTVTILEGFAMDGSGNTNTASAPLTLSYIPQITATLMGPDVVNSAAFTVQVAFSEDVTGFVEASDITVTGGVTAVPAPVGNSARDYTLTITPDGTGDIGIIILEDAISNNAGNNNAASAELTVRYDGTAPTVTLTGPDPATFSSTEAFVVTATFSEAVTGFDAVTDITVTNGATAVPVAVGNSGTTYTLTITPAAGTGDIEISIPAAAAADAATNGNTASETLTVAYAAPADNTPPTVTFSEVPANHDGTSAFMVTVTLSEPSTDFVVGDISISANASGTLTGSGTDYTLTVTPTDTSSITIDIAAGTFTDAATNGNTASETVTVAYTDTTAPTVMLTSATTTLGNRTPFTVTATFSEDVTGFDAVADITVINGIVGRPDDPPVPPVSVDGSARVYTLTITPNGNGNISISIPANAAMDGAGLGNTASAALIVTYTGMDTTGPSAVLTPDSSIGERSRRVYFRNSNAVFEVTVTFDEPVRGFGLDDIIIQGGTTSNFMGMDEDTVYTFDLTPGTGTLQVAVSTFNTGITDLLDNALITSTTLGVGYDATPPTVALSDYPATANASDTTFAVTATFSEAVPGFNAADITVTNGAVTVSGSGPIYTLTITPDGNDGPITIAIAASVVTDVAGNANMASTNADSTTPSDPVSVTYDATPPTVMLASTTTTANNRDPFDVTATFSEPVTGFDAVADITVTNATVTLAGTGPIYTLTITPAGNDGEITIAIAAGVAEDAASNGNMASNTVSVTSDTTPPTVMLTVPNPATYSSTEAFVVTATFSEAVTGFDAVADITVTNGATTVPVAVGNSETTYTLTITPAAGTGDIEISIPVNAAADAATNGNTASETLTVTYAAPADTTEPTVTLTGPDPATFSNTEAFVVTATFSEAVTGFDAVTDITVTNGATTVPVAVSNSETTYTLNITPDGSNLGIEIFIPAAAAMDAATNGNTVSNTVTVAYTDTTPPTVELTGAPTTANASDTTFAVTATFSKAVTGFDVAADITVTNGTVAVPVAMDSSETTYTLTITPTTDGTITITIPANVAADDASNNNMASNTVSVTYDGTPPTIALTGEGRTFNTLPFTAVSIAGTSLDINHASFTSDEWVTTPANVMVTSAPGPTGFRIGTVYSIMHDGTASQITITAPIGSFTDNAGNPNTEAFTFTFNYVDNTPPTVTFTDPPTNHSNSEFMVTVTLSEPSTDFVVGDISISANASGALTGSGTDYTLTVTPTDTNSVTIDIATGSFTDATGNMNTASETLTVTYAAPADTTPPTVTLTGPDPATYSSTEAFVVTATFSEAVTGFDEVADITVTNGTAAVPVAMDSSETIYTLTITPAAGTGDIEISIPADAAADAATNGNTVSETLTVTYAAPADNTPPTVTLTGPDPATFSNTEAFVVTATFSEAVTGFDAVADITVTGGTATVPVATNAMTYTLNITPAGTDDIEIFIPTAAAMDNADNPNTASETVTVTYAAPADNTPPTVTLTGPDPATFSSTEAFVVTATFSEAVTGFDAVTDITVTNGTAMAPVATNAMTYTLTITPAAGTGDIEISIPADAAMDEANNPNTESNTVTVAYVDTTPLTVTLATPAQTANDATAFNVTITFSEDVTGFVLTDIVFNNARALTALQMTNASTYVVPVQADNMADVDITVPAGVAMAGTKTNLASNTLMVPYDHAPTVVLAAAATSMTSPFTVTATFSEAVTGFDVDDITIDNGTVATVPAPVAMSDGTAAYTLTITPTAAGDVTLSIPAGGANDLDGQATANTASNTLTVAYTLPDTTAPTVALTDYPDAVNGPFAVTATFSEAVTGLEATEIDISTNATVTIAGSGTTYTLTITPTTDGTITITIPADVAENDANNGNTASSEVSVTYDGTPPTATFSGAPASHDGMTPFMVTVTLSEPSSNFVEDDTSLTNAVRTLSGSGTDYILTITPLNTSDIGIGIFVDRFTDAAGNGNAFTNATPIPYAAPADTTEPTVTFSEVPANHDGTSEFMVTVTLSEPADDFIAGDITFSDNATGTLTGSGTDYTLTVTPTDNNAITIDIAAGTFTDAATNPNTASETLTVAYAVPDTTPPTVARPVAQFSIVEQTTSFEVTVTFSEAVTGFDAATDIMVTRGTTLAPVAMGDSGMVYTLAITPDGPSGQIVITIPAGVAMDASGNLNTASPTLSVTYIRPVTVVLSLAEPQFISNGRDPFAVTATFSEPVNFIMGDVMVANGTFTASGNGAVYTLTITPTGDTNDAITIQLLEGAGEVGGSGQILPRDSDASEVLQVMVLLDNTPPTVELTGPATFSGETFAVTAEFSEVVTGLTADEITITGASVTISGEGTTYTLTIVPDGTNGDIEITIPADVARDDATNMNTVSNELTVRYDNTPLTVTFTDPPANHSNSEFMVTVTLSEPATGFVVGDIDFSANATGTLTGSGTVYTLTVTPTDTSSITIDIAAGSFTDAAGSPNTASDTLTVTYAAPTDTTPPTVMLSAPDAVNSTATFEVTATFSEPVTGFDETDVDVTHGDLIEITPVTALVSSSLARATLTRQLNASTTGHSFAQIYTLTIMPAGTGDITITINAGGVMDAAGNGNTASMNAAGNTAPVSVAYDTTRPTVTLTGPDPATFSSTEAFVVTATFSENVTGFDAVTDITVNNGTAAVPVAVDNSETIYTLTITPDGTNGDIEIFIPAGAAMDAAGNPNTESEPLTVAYTASADTKAAITGFMLDRANKLASNQPGLARFLQGTDCGTFSANSTDASGSVDGCLSNGHTWGEISRTWSSDNTYTLATVGLHGLMRDDLIIGGLVQFDKADDDKRNITGQGWLVGPYFVRKPTDQNMTFEGRLLYGQTDNDISPLGSYTDSFDTERYLAQLRVTGEYGYRIATMMPSLDLTYTEDTQNAYTDTPGNLIDEQGVDLTQLTFGMDFKLPVAIQTGQLDLTGGLSGTYSETNGGESDVEGGRGRTELGLNYSRGSGTTLRLGTFYDGISSDHESFGVNFSLDMKF